MKFLKKGLCLLLAGVLILVLCSCGSFAPRMVLGMQKMAKLNSLHSDTTLTAEVTLNVLGQEVPATVEVRAAGDHQKEPALNALDLSMHLLDMEKHLLLYTQTEDGVLTVCTSWDDGQFWARSTIEPKAETDDAAKPDSALNAADLFQIAIGLAQYFEESGELSFIAGDGLEHTGISYDGTIPAELIQELLANLDLKAMLGEDFPFELDAEHLALVGELPVSLVLDKKDSTVSRLALDLTAVLGPVLKQYTVDLMDSFGLADAGVGITVNSLRTVTDLSQFDAVTVVMPSIPEQS